MVEEDKMEEEEGKRGRTRSEWNTKKHCLSALWILCIISIKSAYVQNYIHTYYTIFSLWFFFTVYKWLVCWKPLGVDSFPHVYLSGPFHIWLNSCYVTCLNTFLFTMKTNQTKYHRKRYKLNISESDISQHPACDKPEVQLLRTQWRKSRSENHHTDRNTRTPERHSRKSRNKCKAEKKAELQTLFFLYIRDVLWMNWCILWYNKPVVYFLATIKVCS